MPATPARLRPMMVEISTATKSAAPLNTSLIQLATPASERPVTVKARKKMADQGADHVEPARLDGGGPEVGGGQRVQGGDHRADLAGWPLPLRATSSTPATPARRAGAARTPAARALDREADQAGRLAVGADALEVAAERRVLEHVVQDDRHARPGSRASWACRTRYPRRASMNDCGDAVADRQAVRVPAARCQPARRPRRG